MSASVIAALGTSAANATTYYVDFAQGSNSSAGTSTATAWKHAPGDANATGTAATIALQPGDTVKFKGGVTYVGQIELKWSGTNTKPVTYDGSTWNGSRAILTTRNAPDTYGFSDTGSARSYLHIQGFLIRDIGGYAENDSIWNTTEPITSPPGGAGVSLTGGGSDILVQDCHFAEIGQWRNIKPMSGINSVTGAGISLQNNARVNIVGCDFTRMKMGVSIKSTALTSDVVVRNSSFHNYMNWLIDIAPRKAGAAFNNILIDACEFYNYKEFDTPNWQGYGEKPHQDGIFLRTAGMSSSWNNVVVRNSKFYSDTTSSGGTASIYLSQGASADIYNCLFLDDVHSNAYINVGYKKLAGMTQQVRIWNNTFVGSSRALKITPGNSNPDHIEIINNVFYRTIPYDIVNLDPNGIGTLRMDHNLYFGVDASRALNMTGGAGYRTLAAWREQTGLDGNSIWADPQLVDVSGVASSWDLRPGSISSPLIGAGANLSSFFLMSIDGSDRTSNWEIGAFRFQGPISYTKPGAPSGLTATPN